MSTDLVVQPLTFVHVDKWQDLFARAASGCHCRFWHFGGDKNAWLLRVATEPEVNAREAADAVRTDDGTARGLVAIEADRVVGWLKVAPRALMPKLLKMNAYRERTAARDAHMDHALATSESAAPYVLGCFLVDPASRRQGVARALLAAAPAYARSFGATRLEAYPRRLAADNQLPLPDEQAWLGPEQIYIDAGFTAVADPAAVSGSYPVYILPLSSR